MSRKLCSLYLALSVLISTVSIAYADSTPDIHSTEQDYQQAVAVLEDIGLQSGFDSGRTSMDRLYSSGLPAGAQSASLSQLQLMALDEMEAEEEARFQARQADRQKRMEEARVLEQQRKQEEQKKKTLREKQQAAQAAKAAKAAKAATSTTEAGRVGDRPYARGRAYKADRYDETK